MNQQHCFLKQRFDVIWGPANHYWISLLNFTAETKVCEENPLAKVVHDLEQTIPLIPTISSSEIKKATYLQSQKDKAL